MRSLKGKVKFFADIKHHMAPSLLFLDLERVPFEDVSQFQMDQSKGGDFFVNLLFMFLLLYWLSLYLALMIFHAFLPGPVLPLLSPFCRHFPSLKDF